jgi:hypothetical protein
MRRIHWLLAGLALAIGAGALAQVVPGGLPSKPRFQSLVVSCPNAAGCSPGGGVDTRSHICNTGAPSSNQCWSLDVDNTGLLSLVLEADNMTGLSNGLTISRSGGSPVAMKFNGQELAYAAFRTPKFSFGEFIATSGGCSNNTGVWQTQNMTGTCTRNSLGVFTVNFNTAYAGSPICLANATSATAGAASVNTAGTTSVTVGTVNTAFAAADIGSFFVTCMGF